MRAWLYYRLSRDEDEEMNSLQNQRQILVDYAEQNGYEIVGESFDDNVSGMTFNRKGLGKLEIAVDESKIDVVLVKDLSRLGRHRTQTELFIDYLRQNNVKVISVTEGIDSFNENDDLLIGFKQIFNDFYAKDISKKVRTGIRQKQKSGLVVRLPMGYYLDRNTGEVLVDENAAEIVREAFKKYIDGYGLCSIAKNFNERGIKSPEYYSHRRIGAQRTELCKKYLWAQTSVKRLIENECYTGTLVNHKTVTSKIYKTKSAVADDERFRHEGFMPAIIDKNTWDKAQAVLNSHRNTNVRSGGNKIHRYSGLIKCADCGAILVAKNREWNGKQYVEYTCNSNHRYGKEYCTPHRIHEEQIDSVVKCEVMLLSQTILQQSDQYNKIIKNWERQKPKYKKRIQQFNERISVLKYQIENLLIERMEDKEHADIFNEMIKKREKEISELNTKITECLEYDNVCREKSTKLKSTADLLKDILTQPQISDADLRLLIEKIYVHQNADKSLELKIVFNGQFKNTEMVLIEESSIA